MTQYYMKSHAKKQMNRIDLICILNQIIKYEYGELSCSGIWG